MRTYTTEEIESAKTLVASADREFGDYSRTDLLLDNIHSLCNFEDARGLLTAISADLHPARRPDRAMSSQFGDHRRLEAIAGNIVHQIGGALYEALPADVAHQYFVRARQATNDRAIDFAKDLISDYAKDAAAESVSPNLDRAQVVELIEGELERVWDDGNAAGLDGWTGPGRGVGEVDAYAESQRQRDTTGALGRIVGRLYPPADTAPPR